MPSFNFTSSPPSGKDVKDTAQLKPRSGPPPFETSKNNINASSRNEHKPFGALGGKGFAEKK